MASTAKTPSAGAATAALVRKAIAAARRDGTLALPAEARVSVRLETGSSHADVAISITGADAWAAADVEGRQITSPAARAAGQAMADMVRELRTEGYISATAYYDGCRMIGGVSRQGWAPNQD